MKRILFCVCSLIVFSSLGLVHARSAKLIGESLQDQTQAPNLDVYVGLYEVQKDFILTITNENGKLMGEPGGEKVEFKPQANPDEFFSSAVNARLRFARDKAGVVIAVVVSIDGKDFYSKKIK